MVKRIKTYMEAIREAQEQEMKRDKRVILFGLGVDDHKGINGSTLGLVDTLGSTRVFDTPLSEDGMTGVAIGAAIAGLRPIHVHIRMDFLLLAMNQLVNIAAKSLYMFGGSYSVPLVVRSIIGRSWGQGAQHSQGLHSLFMHIPGLKVVAPSTPYDAKGCLISAIRDNNPVMFIEHRMLYTMKSDVPAKLYTVPLGKARILAKGSHVTLVGISYMSVECLRAKEMLKAVDIDAEVIDPVTLSPLDMKTILKSVKKTKHLIIVDTGWLSCGASSEILSRVIEALPDIKVKIKRLGYAATPGPTTKNLENLFYPSPAKIAKEAYLLLSRKGSWKPQELEAEEITQFKGPF